MFRSGRVVIGLAFALVLLSAPRAGAIDLLDGRVQLHGSVEEVVRVIVQDWKRQADLTQMRTVFGLEAEVRLLDSAVGPVDELSTFVRFEVSYDCVWTRACGMARSADAYGDRARVIPSKYTNGAIGPLIGDVPTNQDQFFGPRDTNRLLPLRYVPPFWTLGPNVSFEQAFRPLLSHRFAVSQLHVTTANGNQSGSDAIVLPWRPKDRIDPIASLASVANQTSPAAGLAMRPSTFGTVNGSEGRAGGLYTPSPGLRDLLESGGDISRFDQNFSQNELEWNLGASQQDEWFLREAYVDASMFDGRFALRVGKQNIIWGKTELFRNTDQINPVDLAVATLPSLEESRIPQWAVRGIYSLYDIGPLQDVRFEVVWMFDDFEPTDLGRCGEPYSPLPVCAKTSQLFVHGAFGAGIAGESRPPNWWNGWKGHEIGARLEFRWDRFSFAITDFYGYQDAAVARVFQSYERKVDIRTGRPLNSTAGPDGRCETGNEPDCLKPGSTGPGNALEFNPMNRQAFDVICASSVGFFPALDASSCALSITNSTAPIATLGGTPVSTAVGAAVGGSSNLDPLNFGLGALVVAALSGQPLATATALLAPLNRLDPNTGTFPGTASVLGGLNDTLTVQQRGLLGCGPFFGTDCDASGLDLFNSEASAIFQSWPGVTPGSPVATRTVFGRQLVLPGARTIDDPNWDPGVDGCVADTPTLIAAGVDPAKAAQCAGMTSNLLGRGFRSEMQAVSNNALQFIVALDLRTPNPLFPNCSFSRPLDCPTVQDFFAVTATTRPDVRAGGNGRFGRRDFAWAGAGEILLEYEKTNTLGFAMDFAEDRTGTNWGMELTWTPDRLFASSETLDRLDSSDRYAFTVSVDRPTFIHFLNPTRTFFFNMQWFFEYLPDYVGGRSRSRGFEVNGPWTQLGTFNIQTGYFQDRLQPALTFVYDVQSASGGLIFQTTFRYTANFQLTVGVNNFFGRPQGWYNQLSLGALGASNVTWEREKFDRLNAVRERDEVFMRLRYTF